jgi:hypothetical protein
MSVMNNPECVVTVSALTTTRRAVVVKKNDHNAKNDRFRYLVVQHRSQRV